jgi:hypothetical protein
MTAYIHVLRPDGGYSSKALHEDEELNLSLNNAQVKGTRHQFWYTTVVIFILACNKHTILIAAKNKSGTTNTKHHHRESVTPCLTRPLPQNKDKRNKHTTRTTMHCRNSHIPRGPSRHRVESSRTTRARPDVPHNTTHVSPRLCGPQSGWHTRCLDPPIHISLTLYGYNQASKSNFIAYGSVSFPSYQVHVISQAEYTLSLRSRCAG